MPGMMDTVLNLGLNDETIESVIKKSGNERFAWDSYRRFISMYGDVVMGLKPESQDEEDPFEVIMDNIKEEKGVKQDLDLSVDDLKELVKRFKALIKDKLGREFPSDPHDQLWEAVGAVFGSWQNDRWTQDSFTAMVLPFQVFLVSGDFNPVIVIPQEQKGLYHVPLALLHHLAVGMKLF